MRMSIALLALLVTPHVALSADEFFSVPAHLQLQSTIESRSFFYSDSDAEVWQLSVLHVINERSNPTAYDVNKAHTEIEREFRNKSELYAGAKAVHRLVRKDLDGGAILHALGYESFWQGTELRTTLDFHIVRKDGWNARGTVVWKGAMDSKLDGYVNHLAAARLHQWSSAAMGTMPNKDTAQRPAP